MCIQIYHNKTGSLDLEKFSPTSASVTLHIYTLDVDIFRLTCGTIVSFQSQWTLKLKILEGESPQGERAPYQ